MKTFGSQTVRWEYKIIGDTRFAKLEGPKQGTFFVGHQDRTSCSCPHGGIHGSWICRNTPYSSAAIRVIRDWIRSRESDSDLSEAGKAKNVYVR
jgi:hypothetical protein